MNQNKGTILSTPRSIFLILNYFLGYMFVYPILIQKIAQAFQLNPQLQSWLSFAVYTWMILVSILAGYPLLKENFKKSVRMRKFAENTLLMFVLLYFVSGLMSSLVMLISGVDQSVNQQEIILAFTYEPLLITFTTLIYAPIVEELVFRGAIFQGLRKHTHFMIAAIVSALAFGGIHVTDSLLNGNFNDLWYLLTYGSLGFIFCLSYEKNHSIYGSMLLHFLNNLLGMIGIYIQFFLS